MWVHKCIILILFLSYHISGSRLKSPKIFSNLFVYKKWIIWKWLKMRLKFWQIMLWLKDLIDHSIVTVLGRFWNYDKPARLVITRLMFHYLIIESYSASSVSSMTASFVYILWSILMVSPASRWHLSSITLFLPIVAPTWDSLLGFKSCLSLLPSHRI